MIQYLLKALALNGLVNIIKDQMYPDILHNPRFKTIGTGEYQIHIDDNISTVLEVENDYQYYDIRSTDNVLDLGSCTGAFGLKVSNRVTHVYAVEPIMTELLERNIRLNNVNNITILDCALGNGPLYVSWCGKIDYRYGLTLGEIINICGGSIDFIKCDCEGGEWYIKPYEISNVRRIEAEVHNFSGDRNFEEFENILQLAGFDYRKLTRKLLSLDRK